MSARDGDGVTWPGMASGGEARDARQMRPSWAGTYDPRRAPLLSPRSARLRPWLPVALWVMCGALIGSLLTVVLLFLAGPRPAALPVPAGAGQVTVTVDDAYLTAAIRQASSGVPLVGVESLTAHAVPGDRILLSGSNAGGGSAASGGVTMTLQPLARNGVLTVRVLDARIGGLPLPAFVDAQLGDAIDAQIASLGQSALAGSHYAVTSVTTTYGRVILTLGKS